MAPSAQGSDTKCQTETTFIKHEGLKENDQQAIVVNWISKVKSQRITRTKYIFNCGDVKQWLFYICILSEIRIRRNRKQRGIKKVRCDLIKILLLTPGELQCSVVIVVMAWLSLGLSGRWFWDVTSESSIVVSSCHWCQGELFSSYWYVPLYSSSWQDFPS